MKRSTLHNNKGINPQEDMTIINIYAPNTGAPTYVKQILTELKGEIECNVLILGYFNIPLTSRTDQPDRK